MRGDRKFALIGLPPRNPTRATQHPLSSSPACAGTWPGSEVVWFGEASHPVAASLSGWCDQRFDESCGYTVAASFLRNAKFVEIHLGALAGGQPTAFVTSAAICFSLAAERLVMANETGHIVPSSSCAGSLKPKVEYRSLNLSDGLSEHTILPSSA